jgi:hypothetical protein
MDFAIVPGTIVATRREDTAATKRATFRVPDEQDRRKGKTKP